MRNLEREGEQKRAVWFVFCRMQKRHRSLYTQGLPEFKEASASAWHLADADVNMTLLFPVVWPVWGSVCSWHTDSQA